MTLKSLDVGKRSYKKILKVLEKIFQPEANDMMSHFRFHTIKQRQGHFVDSFLTDFYLALPDCRYSNGQEQLKNQFIFGKMVCDI